MCFVFSFLTVRNFQDSLENIQWRILFLLALVTDAPSSIWKKEFNRFMFAILCSRLQACLYSLSFKKIVDCKTDLMTWISNNTYNFAYSWPDHHQLGMQRKKHRLLIISRNQFGYGLVQFECAPTFHTSGCWRKYSFQMSTPFCLRRHEMDQVLSTFHPMWKSLAKLPWKYICANKHNFYSVWFGV